MPNESDLHAKPPAETHPAAPAQAVVRGPGYEVRDTNVAAIITFVVALVIILTVTQIGLWGLLKLIAGRPAPEPSPTSPYAESAQAGMAPTVGKVTPESILEITEQRRELREREDRILNHGVVSDHARKGDPIRISITSAIERIAEHGLPASGGPSRTEVEVNSHSGKPAPAGPDEKGSKK